MFDSHAFKSNRRNECVLMPRKTARSGSQIPLGRSGMSGTIHPLASGLPASSENAYHPRQFRVHLGNPGLDCHAVSYSGIEPDDISLHHIAAIAVSASVWALESPVAVPRLRDVF